MSDMLTALPAGPLQLRQIALDCLAECDAAAKAQRTRALIAQWRDAGAAIDVDAVLQPSLQPGRPPRPQLVSFRQLAQRGLGTLAGRAAFVHAIAHIEFNAINLAWDAVARFDSMPARFYSDWAAVADDEARHFEMLVARLAEWGYGYGDFDAHGGLWEMAERTAGACLERMALVPRVLEARGLDVSPAMISKLDALGDADTADILRTILNEEVAHVAVGTHWYRWCCREAGVDPLATFRDLVERHALGSLRAPFNHPARAEAGFEAAEMAWIESVAAR